MAAWLTYIPFNRGKVSLPTILAAFTTLSLLINIPNTLKCVTNILRSKLPFTSMYGKLRNVKIKDALK